MEETVKKQEPVTSQEQVIETVTNPKLRRERSKLQQANSIRLGKDNVELKRKKKERLLQELRNQQALHNQQSKADIEEIEKIEEEEPIKQHQTSIYIVLGLVAIIGCGVYCRYSSKPTIPDVQPKEKVEPVKSGIVVKSGIIDME